MRSLIRIRPQHIVEQQPLRRNTRGKGKDCFGPSVIVLQDESYFCCPAESIFDLCQIRRLLLVHGLNPTATGREAQGKTEGLEC